MLRASCYGHIHASPLAPILDFPPTAHYLEQLPKNARVLREEVGSLRLPALAICCLTIEFKSLSS